MNKSVFKEIIEWAEVIAVAFIVAFFITHVIITNSFVPTESMVSTLPVGSRLFGFRLTYMFTKPKRGDVVIFDYGYNCKDCNDMYQKNDEKCCPICKRPDSKNKKVHYIKRVIGVPGDHIEIKTDYKAEQELFRDTTLPLNLTSISCGHVYVNGEKLEEDYLNEPMIVEPGLYSGDTSRFPTMDVVVPDDCYFLLGDNRNNSLDARFWPTTFINIKDIEAKAYVIYWPLNRIGLIR